MKVVLNSDTAGRRIAAIVVLNIKFNGNLIKAISFVKVAGT